MPFNRKKALLLLGVFILFIVFVLITSHQLKKPYSTIKKASPSFSIKNTSTDNTQTSVLSFIEKACDPQNSNLNQEEIKNFIQTLRKTSNVQSLTLWKNYHLKNKNGDKYTLRVLKEPLEGSQVERDVFQLFKEDESGFPWPVELKKQDKLYSQEKLSSYLSQNTLINTQSANQVYSEEIELLYQTEDQIITELKVTQEGKYTECRSSENKWLCRCVQ